MIVDKKFERVISSFEPQSKLVRTWKLQGGVSAQITALEVEHANGQRKRMIVRRHGDVDLQQNPRIAADEFKLLQILYAAGLPVPAPYHLDQSGAIFPTPYLVIEYIEGETIFSLSQIPDLISQFAEQLCRIHRLDCSKQDLSFLPLQETRYADLLNTPLPEAHDPLEQRRIQQTLQAAWPLPQYNAPTLLHGDYWPGNTLWRGGQLVGIIDWEDAALGDPLADLAKSRLEILWAFGIEALHSFTQHYQSLTRHDFTSLPYWDLCAALRVAPKFASWATNKTHEKTMHTQLHRFIDQAFKKLSGS